MNQNQNQNQNEGEIENQDNTIPTHARGQRADGGVSDLSNGGAMPGNSNAKVQFGGIRPGSDSIAVQCNSN